MDVLKMHGRTILTDFQALFYLKGNLETKYLKIIQLTLILSASFNNLLRSMTYFDDHSESIDDILSFDPDGSESKFNNQRSATRYIRNDIKAVLYKVDLLTRFGFNFFRRLIVVQLLDISTRGVLISTDRKLKINSKIVLGLKFISGKTFRIKATIVRKSMESDYEYGIKFTGRHDELGDYLVSSQKELIFK